MSAGQSLRRQNYTFMTITPRVASHSPSRSTSHSTHPMHFTRVAAAVASAIALELATFATLSMLITGR